MPTVLLLAPYFPPRRRVGAMRPLRFALHLRDAGWDPVVMTIHAGGQQLAPRERDLLRDIPVIELRPPLDLTRRSESQLGAGGPNHANGNSRAAGSTKAAGRRLLNLPLPVDGWLPFFWASFRRMVEQTRRLAPDAVWSTGDPWSSLVIAERLCRRLDLPWIADFRDPWTLCPVRTDGRPGWLRAIDRRCERRVLAGADLVLFQATETERRYRQHYEALNLRTATIFNSFDEQLMADPVLPAAAPEPAGHPGELHIGFFGRFREMSPATPILQALARARELFGDEARGLQVHSFGPLNDADRAQSEAAGLSDQFVTRDAVPLEDCLGALRTFDLLLVSTDPRRSEIIPAKLLEYLATGRPVLSLSPNPEVGAILERTGAGVQRRLDDVDGVARLLMDCLRARRAGEALPLPFDWKAAAVAEFEAGATTRQLAALLDSIRRQPGGAARPRAAEQHASGPPTLDRLRSATP